MRAAKSPADSAEPAVTVLRRSLQTALPILLFEKVFPMDANADLSSANEAPDAKPALYYYIKAETGIVGFFV